MARPTDGPRSPAPPKPTVENRWWVEQANAKEKERRAAARAGLEPESAANLPGAHLFRIGKGFDQEQARARLTDANLNFLREANPAPNEWGYLQTADVPSPKEILERTKRALRLPPGARGVLVDAGTSLRAIVTGSPVGERLVEVSMGVDACLDAWRNGDWVVEKVFSDRDRALAEAPAVIAAFLRDSSD